MALVLGSLLILGGIGFGVYLLVSKGKKAPPAGWKEYVYKNDGFKAYLPGEPHSRSGTNSPIQLSGTESATIYMVDGWGPADSRVMMIAVLKFRSGTQPPDLDKAANELKERSRKPDSRVSEPRSVTWGGQKAREITIEEISSELREKGRLVVRCAIVGSRAFIAVIGGEGSSSLSNEDAFFDNFEFLK